MPTASLMFRSQGFPLTGAHPREGPEAAGYPSLDPHRLGFQTPPLRQHQQQQPVSPGHDAGAGPAGLRSVPADHPGPAALLGRREQAHPLQQRRQHERMLAESAHPAGFRFGPSAAQPRADPGPQYNPFSEMLHSRVLPWLPPGHRGDVQTIEQPLQQLSSMTMQARRRHLLTRHTRTALRHDSRD